MMDSSSWRAFALTVGCLTDLEGQPRKPQILTCAKPRLEIKRVIASQRPYHDFLASLEAPFSVKNPTAIGGSAQV